MVRMKAAFHTLGCKTNSYETQAVREQFERAGFTITPFSEEADVYIINTCSVTAVAAQKSRQMLRRCRKQNRNALVVACGCYAQEAAEALREGGVDLVVGNNEKSKILTLVREWLLRPEECVSCAAAPGSRAGSLDLPGIFRKDLARCAEYERQTITHAGTHVRAYVKIQDGCNRFCSYCIIPYLRGRSRSRSREDILREVKTLSAGGIKEIVLTGIDISDFRSETQDTADALAELILTIEQNEAIERIRLGSLEAGVITRDFLERIRGSRKLCPHFHLSLQSGCEATLHRMNRHYTPGEFMESVCQIRAIFKHPAITTDVIAGFAGETEAEFEETKQFVRKAGFSQLHVFPYSRRKGTRAAQLPGQLSRAEKAKRTAELIDIGRALQLSYMRQFIGRKIKILTEAAVQIDGGEYLVGFTPEYVKAAVRGDCSDVNKIVINCPEQIIEFQKDPILV